MRKIMISVIAMMMVVGLMVSCDNANISPELKAEELVSVSFDEGASRGLTGSIEAFSKGNYYWKYAAQKADASGLISGQTRSYDESGAEWITGKDSDGNRINGLGSVAGFSQGYWNFKLFAYSDNAGNNLAYTGEITGQLLKKGDSNKVMVTVAPIASGNGTLKVDTTHISFVPKQNSALTEAQLASFAKKVTVQKWENGAVTGNPEHNPEPVNGALTYNLSAGTYKVTVKFVRNDGITYTEGYAIATVYSNVTTIVSGYLDEFTTNADFDSDAEVINRVAVSEPKDIPTEGDVFSDDVELNDSVQDVSDRKATAVVPMLSANSVVSSAVAKSEYSGENVSERSVALQLSVDTTAATKSSVTLEIGMSSVLTTKLQDDNTNYVETVPVKALDDYVTVKVNLSAGLSNVAVKHTVEGNVLNMHNVSSEDIEGDSFTVDSDKAGVFYYNDGNGTLTIKTKTFSPFEVSYIAPVWVAKIDSTKYLSLQSAIDEASDGSIIELMTDVVVDGEDPVIINTSNKLEINLNGNSITGNGMRALWVKAGDVSITGTGTISSTEGIDDDSSVIRVADKYSNEDEAKLTIGSNVVVSSDYSYAITVFGLNKGTLVVDGTIRSKDVPAISGNGGDSFEETCITINGSVETINENAIYHPQAGELIINGTVLGNGGIELKSGHLVVNEGASITSDIDPQTPSRNSNGCSTSGFAIVAVNNKDYKCGANVEILGGTITGVVGIVDDDNELPAGKEKATVTAVSNTINTIRGFKWDKKWSADRVYTLMETWYGRESDALHIDETAKKISIGTAGELALFAKNVNEGNNKYNGYTVLLTDNINLENKIWTPIQGFLGSFDGQNFTISNLMVLGGTELKQQALFGASWNSNGQKFENVILHNVFVTGHSAISAFVADTGPATIQNVTVTGDIYIGITTDKGYLPNYNSSYAGVIYGHGYANVINCHVIGNNGSAIGGGRQIGGIVGFESEGSMCIQNCSVKNLTVSGTFCVGGIVGWAYYGNNVSNNTVENITIRITNSDAHNSTGFITGCTDSEDYEAVDNKTGIPKYMNFSNNSASGSSIYTSMGLKYDSSSFNSLYAKYGLGDGIAVNNNNLYLFMNFDKAIQWVNANTALGFTAYNTNNYPPQTN